MERATLGGGCFWCLDAVYRELQGVDDVVAGYAGGDTPEPTYEQVCSGRTGHAEVVQVTYDPAVVSYRDLLRVFFTIHDPTTKDRQGADVGSQYRSIVFVHDDGQRAAVKAAIDEAQAAWDDPIVTEVEPLEAFHPAEEHHQDYFARNPHQGYCQAVISPKLAKFRKTWTERLRS